MGCSAAKTRDTAKGAVGSGGTERVGTVLWRRGLWRSDCGLREAGSDVSS
jgi:hypothetical protein